MEDCNGLWISLTPIVKSGSPTPKTYDIESLNFTKQKLNSQKSEVFGTTPYLTGLLYDL